MIFRPYAIEFLQRWREKNVIKVVSGIRRCGKSTLLQMFRDSLLQEGVSPDCITFLNFEDMSYEEIALDIHKLHDYIGQHLRTDGMNYIFLDEIQHVKGFERVVDSLYIKPNVDIYITGSNAYFMSGELATLLSGRYVELKLLPLSFAEYCSAPGAAGKTQAQNYRRYISRSSMPYTLELDSDIALMEYLRGTYSTVILKDVVARFGISDVAMLESVTAFLLDAVGNIISPRKIADTMTSMGRKIDGRTVEKYIRALTDSMLFYRAPRYDLKGKQLLDNSAKYYTADIGFRRLMSAGHRPDSGHVLENVIYLELLRRGYKVYVGKPTDGEIDFVVMRGSELAYYQVSLSVLDENTLRRELAPLEKLNDNYPKYLLTLDEMLPDESYGGIIRRNALEWLTEE